jgi:transposase
LHEEPATTITPDDGLANEAPNVPLKRGEKEVPDDIRKEIVRLYTHYGTRAIAQRVRLSRKVVRRVLDEEGVAPRTNTTTTGSKLDDYREDIEAKLKVGLTTSRILREIRDMGYEGSRTILADHVRELRKIICVEKPKKKVTRRFETGPAAELQVDWSPYDVEIGGKLVIVYALAVLLCFSRKLFVAFFRHDRQHSLLEGLARAFEYFRGCAKTLVLDNMATAVLGRWGKDRKVEWHPKFVTFCRHYGTNPYACKPRHPNRKGKDEKAIRLVGDDFIKGRKFDSWCQLDMEGVEWLDNTPGAGNLRIHGTIRQQPNELFNVEQPLLIKLPDERFPVFKSEMRVVDQDSTLSVDGTRFTVPAALANRTVPVRLFAHHFEVLDRDERIVLSRRYPDPADKGKLVIDPTHYASLPRSHADRSSGIRLDDDFIRRFPTLRPLVDGIRHKVKGLVFVHISKLIQLAERFGAEPFLAVCERLMKFHRYDALAAERILEKEYPLVPKNPEVPLAGIDIDVVTSVEEGSIDELASLDTDPASSQDVSEVQDGEE